MGTSMRWGTVLLTIAAWFCLSNHCAFGLSASPAEAVVEAGQCPMHSAPAKQKPAPHLPCCKDLRAVASPVVKSVAAFAQQLVGSQEYAAEIFLPPPHLAIELYALDTGPPGALTFAESVLQRSILAHAPPVS